MNAFFFESNVSNRHLNRGDGQGADTSDETGSLGSSSSTMPPLRFVHVCYDTAGAFSVDEDDESLFLPQDDDLSSAGVYQLDEGRTQTLKSDVAPDQPFRKDSLHTSKADGAPLQPLRRASADIDIISGCVQAAQDPEDDDVASFTSEATASSMEDDPATSALLFLASKAFTLSARKLQHEQQYSQRRRRHSDKCAGARSMRSKISGDSEECGLCVGGSSAQHRRGSSFRMIARRMTPTSTTMVMMAPRPSNVGTVARTA